MIVSTIVRDRYAGVAVLETCPVNVFRLGKRGLERVLGSLESDVLEALWGLAQPATAGDVQRMLRPVRPLSFNTVMTVMNRLVEKGLLAKEGGASPYLYRPCYTREAFFNGLTRGVAAGLVRDFGDYAVSQFLAALIDENPSALADLERLVQEARQRQGGCP